MSGDDLTVAILREIRDDIRDIKGDVRAVNVRVDATNERLDRLAEGQIRIATEVAELRGEVGDLRGVVTQQGDRLENAIETGGQFVAALRGRVERHVGLESF